MRTREEALASPQPGDRWRIGGENWAEEGCDLEIHKWEGSSMVSAQAGLMSKMFFCNWDANLLAKFQRWAKKAEYLGVQE